MYTGINLPEGLPESGIGIFVADGVGHITGNAGSDGLTDIGGHEGQSRPRTRDLAGFSESDSR